MGTLVSMGMDEVLKAVRPFAKVDDATWNQVEKHVAEHGLTGAAGNIVRAAVEKAGSRSEAGRKAAQARWGNRSGGGDAAEQKKSPSRGPSMPGEGRGSTTEASPGGRGAAEMRWSDRARAQNEGKNDKAPKDMDNKALMDEINRVDAEMGRMPAGPKGADAPKYNALADRLSTLMGEADDRGWVDRDGNFTGKAPRR